VEFAWEDVAEVLTYRVFPESEDLVVNLFYAGLLLSDGRKVALTYGLHLWYEKYTQAVVGSEDLVLDPPNEPTRWVPLVEREYDVHFVLQQEGFFSVRAVNHEQAAMQAKDTLARGGFLEYSTILGHSKTVLRAITYIDKKGLRVVPKKVWNSKKSPNQSE
jgi:hypothetical protein